MLNLLSFSEELAQHGLKQDSYTQIVKYCSHRIRSLRLQNGLKYSSSKSHNKFSFKTLSRSLILSNQKVALIPIYSIIKLWSRIQMIQVEARSQPRKKHYIRKLSHKIQKLADSKLCNREKSFDDYLFYLWAKGISFFSANKLPESKAFLEIFIKDLPSEIAAASPWKSVETLIRFCDYQLKKASIEVSPVKVPIFDKGSNTALITVHGIDLQVPSAFVNSIRSKKPIKDSHPTLSILFEIRQALKKDDLFNNIEALKRIICKMRGYKELAAVESFLKAHFAKNVGATVLAKNLFNQVSNSLRKGIQLFPVSLKIKSGEKSNISLAKKLIGQDAYSRIESNPIPVKPIVYDLAYDYLGEKPLLASTTSKPGIFTTFWK